MHGPSSALTRREFLLSAGAAAGLGLDDAHADESEQNPPTPGSADACIFLWLPGGIAQADTWDPKEYTPFRPGMRGSELLATFPRIPTAADGIFLSAGLERIASVLDRGTLVRTVVAPEKFGAIHAKAQHCLLTGYVFPASVAAPSLGSWVANLRGRRTAHVPAYFDLGRDLTFADAERQFIASY